MTTELNIRKESPEDLAALYEEYGHGLTDVDMDRKKEPLRVLEVAPDAFQFRDPYHRSWTKERHVRKLVQAFDRQENYFDPILLFAIKGHRLVLDGHCRLRAYLRADLPATTEVPVRYFRGDFIEAITRPASENSKEKLALTLEEKLEAAWRLVLFDEMRGNYSLRQVAKDTGASKSTVGNMRKVLENDTEFGFEPRDRTWKEVKSGQADARDINENWEENRAKAWAGQLRNQLGDKPNDTPQCLLQALEIGYPQIFPHAIPLHWAEDSGIMDEILEQKLDDFQF